MKAIENIVTAAFLFAIHVKSQEKPPPADPKLDNVYYHAPETGVLVGLPRLCTFYPDSGFCVFRPPNYGYVVRWYYNTTTTRCEPFWYSQCGGNQNRFLSDDHCGFWCTPRPANEKLVFSPANIDSDNRNTISVDNRGVSVESGRGPLPLDACEAGPDRGTQDCAGAKEEQRFYWDPVAFDCLAFKYNGCGGNLNSFRTMPECRRRCQPQDGTPCIAAGNGQELSAASNQGPPSDCSAATCPDTHICTMGAFFPTCCPKSVENEKTCKDGSEALRYPQDGYIFAKKCADLLCPLGYACEQGETYGKCCKSDAPIIARDVAAGLKNTRSQPLPLRCIPFPSAGNCSSREIRWFFEYRSGRCERFYYSGCGGNGNNFNSLGECNSFCVSN